MSQPLRGFVACFFSLSLLLVPFALPPTAWCWALYAVLLFAHLQWGGHLYCWAEGGAP